MEHLAEIIIPTLAILCIFGLPIGLGLYMGIRSNNQKHIERMEMIKQGLIPEEGGNLKKFKSLRNGLMLSGVALGFIISFIVKQTTSISEDDWGILLLGSVLFLMGAGYIIYYRIITKKEQEENN